MGSSGGAGVGVMVSPSSGVMVCASRVAVGSRRVEPQSFSLPEHKLPDDYSEETSAMVTVGEEVTLGGEAQLQPPKKKADLKTWLLWTVLVLGVLVMGWMARGLLKEMKESG